MFEYNEGPPPPMPPASRRDEEVREWLRSLRLGVLPREEASELLSNPLRNGVLLSDLMTTLVGAPPLRRRDRDPRSLAVARANVERALVPLRTIPGAIPPQLTWSTEGMLKGMRENIFGLLWYVKRAVPEQKRYARAAVPWEDPAAGPGVARVGKPGSHVLGGGLAYASTPRMSLPGTPRSPLVGAPANVAETLAIAAAAGDVSALNVADATVTGTPAECAELGANRCSESYQFVPLPVARNARNARNSSPSAAPGIATRIERGVATSGYEALAAYGDEGIRRLESSVVRWLHAMGLLSDDALAGSFATLCPELSKGTLLCDLVAAIEGIPVVGVFRPPKSVATARANVRRACERLARHRGMCRRHLFDHDEIAAGSPGAVLALLEDVRVFYDGHPPRTSAKHWNENVPYCPEMGMGRPPPGRDANPPPTSPGRVLDPMRAMERGDDEDRDEDPDDDVNLDDEDAFRSDSEPARGSRDRSRDRSNDRDPSLIVSPPGIRDGAHPHPRSPPSDPTATPPPSGAPVRLGASVGSFARPSGPSRPSLVASSPVKAARDAAAALEGWRASVVATVDRATDGSYSPTVSTRPTRVGEVVRAGAWEASSFPRTRAGAAEVEKSRAERSAAAAAAAVAAHHASPRERETPPRRRVDVGDAAAARRREEETRANRRFGSGFGSGFDSATAARAREAERARKRDAEAHARGEGEPNRDRRGARTDRCGARTDRCGARTPPRGRNVGDREGYRSFAPASPGGGVYRPPASPRAPTPPRTRLSRTTDASPNASRPTRPISYRTSTAERAARFQARRAARKRRDAAETETEMGADDGLAYPTSDAETTGERQNRSPNVDADADADAFAFAAATKAAGRFAGGGARRDARSDGLAEEDREAIRLATWIDGLGISLRRAGGSLGGSPGPRSGAGGQMTEFRRVRRGPAAELAAACADGTLLCELVRALERAELAGVTWRPSAPASKLHNVKKALGALREQPAMSLVHLWCEREIVAKDVAATLGLLGDMHACVPYRKVAR